MSDILNGANPWDIFFHYGKIKLEDEVVYDLYEMLLQNKRSMFYFRDGSGGVSAFENMPVSIQLILLKYEVASAIANRNIYVSNGENKTRDRRAATSQEYINVSIDKEKNVDVSLTFFLYSDYKSPKRTSFILKK